MELTSKQRKRLRGIAHELEPVVHVGKGGLTPEVVRQVDRALADHELIKVRLLAERAERAAWVDALCERARCGSAGAVGRIAILYRPHAEAEKRKIVLPDA